MYIIKADGRKELYQKEKIIRTCVRNGMNRSEAWKIENKLKEKIHNGVSTHELYSMLLEELENINHPGSFTIGLRDAIADMDSESFEIYIKKILESYGYACAWNKLIRGAAVEHQVDVTAYGKDGSFLIECKKHINPHRLCGLGIILQVQARLEDIIDGSAEKKNSYSFTAAWIFNNTKFSEHAKQYAESKGIRLSGWHYKDNFSIEHMAQKNKTFPITILKLSLETQQILLKNRIITCQDLMNSSHKFVGEDIMAKCRQILSQKYKE